MTCTSAATTAAHLHSLIINPVLESNPVSEGDEGVERQHDERVQANVWPSVDLRLQDVLQRLRVLAHADQDEDGGHTQQVSDFPSL